MKYGTLNLGQIEALVNKLGGQSAVNLILRNEVTVNFTTRSFYQITVDYHQSFTDMLAAGKLDKMNEHITAENFPITGEGRVSTKIILVPSSGYTETDYVAKELRRVGLRPATLPELLAFGAAYPDMQRHFDIVALGSKWTDPSRNHCYVPFLTVVLDNMERELCLLWGRFDRSVRWRFAAVPVSASASADKPRKDVVV